MLLVGVQSDPAILKGSLQFSGRLHIYNPVPRHTDQRNSHTGQKGDICKEVHCSIDCGGGEVKITCVSIAGGWTVKCGECTHGGHMAALEDLKK